MKIYFLADTHLGAKSDNPIILKDMMDYYNNVFIPYCRAHVQPDDILVHLGDVFDNRAHIGLNTITCAFNLFEELSTIFSDIRICVGNHDMFQKSSNDITGLYIVKYIPNIKIYFEPQVETICEKDILFMPWIEDLKEQSKLCKLHNVDYIMGHLEINGSVTNSRKNIKLKSNDAVDIKDFKKAHVFAGHIHIRQKSKNITYVGTPYHKDRGDCSNTKGITILDLETGKTQFVENTYSPQYIAENIYDILDCTVEELKSKWNNNYVDLYINSNHIIECKFDKLRELLSTTYREFNPISNKVDVVVENKEIKISDTKSTFEVIDEYMNFCDVDDDIKQRIKTKLDKFKDEI